MGRHTFILTDKELNLLILITDQRRRDIKSISPQIILGKDRIKG